jgi:hypothetical protein
LSITLHDNFLSLLFDLLCLFPGLLFSFGSHQVLEVFILLTFDQESLQQDGQEQIENNEITNEDPKHQEEYDKVFVISIISK